MSVRWGVRSRMDITAMTEDGYCAMDSIGGLIQLAFVDVSFSPFFPRPSSISLNVVGTEEWVVIACFLKTRRADAG